MFKIRYYTRLFLTFFQKQRRIIILTGITTFFTIFIASKLIKFNLFPKQQKIGIVGRYEISNLPPEVANLISYGLTNPLSDGSVEPGLAESWEVLNNGKEYIFTIRNGVLWHDKTEVVAKDINYNFSDVNTEVLDKYRIKFILREPFSAFPVIVSRPIFKKNLIGLGNYRVKSIKTSGQFIKNITLIPISEKNLKLIFKFYPNENVAKTAFKLGEIDILKDVSSLNEFENWKNCQLKSEIKYDRYVGLFFNTQLEKFNYKSIRQALAYAIKKEWKPRALSSYNPNSWAYNDSVKPYDYDLENAKRLIHQNDNGINIREIKISTTPSLLEVAEIIKKNWQELDIKTEVQIVQNLTDDFEVLLVTQQIPRDPDQYVLWHSTQENNLSKYKSPRLDVLLEEGRKTLDQEKRKQIYFEFQKSLVEDSPAIFLFYPTTFTIERK